MQIVMAQIDVVMIDYSIRGIDSCLYTRTNLVRFCGGSKVYPLIMTSLPSTGVPNSSAWKVC